MDFFRELWFILKNVPDLAHRYQGHAVWASFSAAISIASYLVKHRFPHPWALAWVSRASAILTGVVFFLAFIDLARSRLPFDDLVCSDIAVDAFYHTPAEKKYELVQRCRCSNRTSVSIRDFAPLRDGYYEKIPAWKVQYALLGSPSVDLIVHDSPEPEPRKNNFSGGSPIIYLYKASAEFNPPLPAGDSVDLVYKVSAEGVMVDPSAFSRTGALFARGVEYDTLRYFVSIHAPSGYQVKLLEWGVIEPGGRILPDETRRQDGPSITPTGNTLQWRVTLARRHLRYMLRYTFQSYEFGKS